MYVDKLEIKNFKCFEGTAFELNYPGRETKSGSALPTRLPNVNLFLGGNGTGKSSVFKALTLAILGPIVQGSGIRLDYMVRRKRHDISNIDGQDRRSDNESFDPNQVHIASFAHVSAQLELNAIDIGRMILAKSPTSKIVISRRDDFEFITSYLLEPWQNALFVNHAPGFFLACYGSNRRSSPPDSYSPTARSPRYQRAASLFEEHADLAAFNNAYLQLKDRGRLIEAQTILNSLLPDVYYLTEQTDNLNNPMFAYEGISLPYNTLSDGYRIFISWIWDLLFQLSMIGDFIDEETNLADVPGVVIVDEIDLFLHPEWQRLVVQQVAEAFPNIQFLFSTHSPLVAGTLEAAHIYVLDNGKVEQYREEIYGLPPNQVLTSSYFGLASTRASGTGTLVDLAKAQLGIDDPEMLTVQADPDDLPAPNLDVARRLIKNATANAAIADKPKSNGSRTTRKRGAKDNS